MKKLILASAAGAAFLTAASAQQMPSLSDFLGSCYRDANICKIKLKDYIVASDSQHTICRPSDMSVNDAASEMLHWLRSDDTHDKNLNDGPMDDAFYLATTTLWPCKPPPAAGQADQPPATPQ